MWCREMNKVFEQLVKYKSGILLEIKEVSYQ